MKEGKELRVKLSDYAAWRRVADNNNGQGEGNPI